MSDTNNVDWQAILMAEAANAERDYHILINVDETVILEAKRIIGDSIDSIGLIHPNVAKIAGLVAFWLRKLKPLSISRDSPNYLLTLNEVVALRVGLAICNAYKDDTSKAQGIRLPPRILSDWVKNFRYHSHSPSSSIVTFELLTCDV